MEEEDALLLVLGLEGCLEDYPIAEFQNVINDDIWSSEKRKCGWVFWREETHDHNQESSSSSSSLENFKCVLQSITASYLRISTYYLVQFWAPMVIGDKSCLRTSDQPFAIGMYRLSEGLCRYRKYCMDFGLINVGDGAKEEELGPIGRVFRNGHPESSPDLRLYNTIEHPLRDEAARCGVKGYVALPVFDLHGSQCLGVLEFSSPYYGSTGYHFEELDRELKEANLRSTHIDFCVPQEDVSEQSALTEIKGMLKAVSKASELCLAQVWVPCRQCETTDNNLSCAELILSETVESTLDCGADWRIFQFCKVQIGKGIAGIVLASENKSCLFPSLCDFSITEEPRAHCVARNRLDVCFAICLQSSYTGNKPYIIEFFLDPACRKYAQLCSFSHFLQSVMKRELKSFKYAWGNQIGDELVVEVIKFGENNELLATFQSHQPVGKLPFKFKVISYAKEMEHQVECYTSNGLGTERNALETEQNVMIAENFDKGFKVTTEESIKERNETSFDISFEVLKQHFGKRIEDVIKELGVSRSTFKRIIRGHGIKRWPSNMKNRKNPSIFETSTAYKRVREMPKTDDVVIILATFGDDIVKFEFCLSWKMEKLIEEVARRFQLKIGSFKLKYVDEADRLILLACDDDLKLCLKTLTSLGKTPIQVLVQSICLNFNSFGWDDL